VTAYRDCELTRDTAAASDAKKLSTQK